MINDVEKKKEHPRYHRTIKCFAIEVCEGLGTVENPMRLVYYVINERGEPLGVIDDLRAEGVKDI